MTDTNDRAQVPEGMVDVYIETTPAQIAVAGQAVSIEIAAQRKRHMRLSEDSVADPEAWLDMCSVGRVAIEAALAAAPKPDWPSDTDVTRLVEAAGRALGALQNSSDMIMGYGGKKWAQRPIDDLDAALAPFTDPQQEGEKSAGVASAAPAAMTSLSDALAHIAAVGTGVAMKAQWNALHTILSTLVAEREAQGRRDERVREAARKLGSETYDVALSALAAALGEDGR